MHACHFAAQCISALRHLHTSIRMSWPFHGCVSGDDDASCFGTHLRSDCGYNYARQQLKLGSAAKIFATNTYALTAWPVPALSDHSHLLPVLRYGAARPRQVPPVVAIDSL